jgi:hypothetical protein
MCDFSPPALLGQLGDGKNAKFLTWTTSVLAKMGQPDSH